jgi:hypothetical protein
MYRSVERNEIVERIEHIRELLRQTKLSTEEERLLQKSREHRLKNFLGNLRRTSARPMARTLNDIERLCLLTKDGAYRLFGYSLDSVRKWDLQLNGSRTHLVESYVFDQDYEVELPLELASENEFGKTAFLKDLVRRWQPQIPIRQLSRRDWHHPGTLYVRIGTEDSAASQIPPGATAVVQSIEDAERWNPISDGVYLLQFPNGYQCSRCRLVDRRLHLSTGETFLYPGMVRIVGRVRAYATVLPLTSPSAERRLCEYDGNADLVLPCEHRSLGKLFATEYRRIVRTEAEQFQIQDKLEAILPSKLSERTRRRYRSETDSEPHVDTLIQMCLENYVRYYDVLRVGGYVFHAASRFSLESMLLAKHFGDLEAVRPEALLPQPVETWNARRSEFLEYGALFAINFPTLSSRQDRVLRIGNDAGFYAGETYLNAGSWLLLEEPNVPGGVTEFERSPALYVMPREFDFVFGSLEHDGDNFALVDASGGTESRYTFGLGEVSRLRRVRGAVIPV